MILIKNIKSKRIHFNQYYLMLLKNQKNVSKLNKEILNYKFQKIRLITKMNIKIFLSLFKIKIKIKILKIKEVLSIKIDFQQITLMFIKIQVQVL